MSLQDPLTLSIKGMVCNRCINVLRKEFQALGLNIEEINLGSVKLSGTSALKSLTPLQQVIEKNGFALLSDKKQETLEQTKATVAEYFQKEIAFCEDIKLPVYLSKHLDMHYESLSTLFSSLTGSTLEHYAMEKRLEKVKELLVYTQIPLMEIAARTGFSSVHHLSNHFKAQTGLPPSHFRKIGVHKKKMTDE
ncbi:AraC family transcriptional regulator [Catalinimonas niigatensis]|uniref:AraC family transcriptional regulator n=1 Tax=Catalinimonas niigatensis TaxID=1397264 RepID=UPI0026666729|nr:AraC family transcriptional regulator [Catalinimonas niigatensis]WPP48688.1 AraC family transcriptional regulator [Catalinimonas niigatensis]